MPDDPRSIPNPTFAVAANDKPPWNLPAGRREIQDERLGRQSAMRKTMVFITHDFPEAIGMGDHIAFVKGGEDRLIGENCRSIPMRAPSTRGPGAAADTNGESDAR